jgi:endonuclease VIII
VPEGDTIHRSAKTLREAIVGKIIRRFASTRILSRDLSGKGITAVEAHGKHLLIRLSDGRAIQAHMGMTGSMHIYRPGERWRRPEGMARMLIEIAADAKAPTEYVVVAFSVPTLRLIVAKDDVPKQIAHLGPDVLAPEFDAPEAVRRMRARQDQPLGVVIMDQAAVAGVGNIYKSETLFTVGVDPFLPVASFSDDTLSIIVERARRLMKSNLQGRTRTTTRSNTQRFYVYRRKDRPCVRCGTVIDMRRQGEQARSTYFCPRCQLGRTSPRS